MSRFRFDRCDWRAGPGLVPCLVLLALLACPPGARAARSDFGDAPDHRAAGYLLSPGVTSTFPTAASSAGPRHRSARLRIGLRHNSEPQAREIDRDRSDDGILAMSRLRRCRASTVRIVVDASRLTARQRRTGAVVLNGWFDWNRNGRWGDRTYTCADEWAIQNVPVPARRLGPDRRAIVPIRLRAGSNIEEFWYRVTATLDRRLTRGSAPRSGAPSTGPLRYGETEDGLHRNGSAEEGAAAVRRRGRARTSPQATTSETLRRRGFSASCPDLVMEHGDSEEVTLDIVTHTKEGGRMEIETEQLQRGESVDVDVLRWTPSPRIRGYRVTSKLIHRRGDLPEERFSVKFRISGHGSSGLLRCRVNIVHANRVEPRGGVRKPPAGPAGLLPDGSPFFDRDGLGRGSALTYTLPRCVPDPLQIPHGGKDSLLLVARDLRADDNPPRIAVRPVLASSPTATFELLTQGGDTREYTPLSERGVLVTSARRHATADPIESYTLHFELTRAGDPTVGLECRVDIVHDPLPGTQPPGTTPPERTGSEKQCRLVPNTSDTVDCRVVLDGPSRGVVFRTRTGGVAEWAPPEGTGCSQPEGPARLRCELMEGAVAEPGHVYATRLRVSGTELEGGIAIDFVDRSGNVSPTGVAPVE